MEEFEQFNWDGCKFPRQYVRALFDFARSQGFKKGLEVGFDTGSSALAFLRACPEAVLLSVDVGDCKVGVQLIDSSEVNNRHTFLKVDSRDFLPRLHAETSEKFDYIYIDGDHLYDVVLADLENADRLLADGGVMVVDDADSNHTHFGVYRAVTEFCVKYKYFSTPLQGAVSSAVVLRRLP